MIAVENIRKFCFLDFLAVAFLAGLWFALAFAADSLLSPHLSYIISAASAAACLSFSVLLVRKAGVGVLFYLIGGLLGMNVAALGPVGSNKLVALFIAAVIFELVFLILKLEFRNISLDIVVGVLVSLMSVPVSTAFLISPSVAKSMVVPLANLVLIALFSGIIGIAVSLFVWSLVKNKKFLLRFRYECVVSAK